MNKLKHFLLSIRDSFDDDKIEGFFISNNIDKEAISNSPKCISLSAKDLDELVSKFGMFDNPIFEIISIADIVGADYGLGEYDKSNILNNFDVFFSRFPRNDQDYNTRSNGMLLYDSSNIMSNLSLSFDKEPIVVSGFNDNKYIVTSNGMHRYHLLRTHYLNELVKGDISEDSLRKKYSFKAKVFNVDYIKTYCNFLIYSMNDFYSTWMCNEYNDEYKKTDRVCVTDNYNKFYFNDFELISYIRSNIDKLKYNINEINYYCENIPYFNNFISLYFPELKDYKRVHFKTKKIE